MAVYSDVNIHGRYGYDAQENGFIILLSSARYSRSSSSSGKSNEETKSIQFWNINSHCDDSGAASSSNSGRAFWHITIGHIN